MARLKIAYLNEAIKIIFGRKTTYLIVKSGAVYDNINGKGEIQRNWIFTYNIGTFLGAAHELYKITGDKQYLDDAVKAANFVVEQLSQK